MPADGSRGHSPPIPAARHTLGDECLHEQQRMAPSHPLSAHGGARALPSKVARRQSPVMKGTARPGAHPSAHATGIAITLSEKDCTRGSFESSSPMITGLFSIV